MNAPVLIADTVTKLGREARGAILVAGSHGGTNAAHAAAAAGVSGVILSDAGIGLDEAGISGLSYLDRLGIPCAAIDHRSARIGDGADCAARGIVSHVNRVASGLGLRPGMTVQGAASLLSRTAPSVAPPRKAPAESRRRIELGVDYVPVWLIDSASQVEAADAGSVVVTGSHGGLVGGNPATAIRAPVRAALFNDAGPGVDRAGISRLPALDLRGIAAATVAAWSARIGDARSTYEDGVLSHVNAEAMRHGAAPGISARAFVTLLARRPVSSHQEGIAL